MAGRLWEDVLDLIRERALRRGEFTLASGCKSNWYVDLRVLTHETESRRMIGRLLHDAIGFFDDPDGLAGPVLGACPLLVEAQDLQDMIGRPTPILRIRAVRKDHGRQDEIIGPKGLRRVVIIDDVVTTGGSIQRSTEALYRHDCKVIGAVCVVSRCGSKDIQGVPLFHLYDENDIFPEEGDPDA